MPDTEMPPPAPTRESIKAELYALIESQLTRVPASLSDDFHFSDGGVASLEVMMLVFEVEEKFDIALVDAGLDDFDTLGELVTLVHHLVERKAGQA
ncbi:MAG: acyl carrier protein [Elstera sp.]